jgi:hypothetical protein
MRPGRACRTAIEFIHCGHDAVLEFLIGCDPDVAQHRAGELGEETLDQVSGGAIALREDKFKTPGRLIGEPSLCLLGDGGEMIVEDQLCNLSQLGKAGMPLR